MEDAEDDFSLGHRTRRYKVEHEWPNEIDNSIKQTEEDNTKMAADIKTMSFELTGNSEEQNASTESKFVAVRVKIDTVDNKSDGVD